MLRLTDINQNLDQKMLTNYRLRMTKTEYVVSYCFYINLESSWKPRYSTVLCCLMEWAAKDVLISLKPLAFGKRMDLVLSSPKYIDSLFAMNHGHSDENSLFKTFSIFFNVSMLLEDTCVICIPIGACV